MDIKKYIYGHCATPVRVQVYDSYSKQYVVKELPCGKCLHCRNTRVNEWVTRLYSQLKYSKYAYYITLDYAPFDLSNDAAYLLASETAAVEHDKNTYHTLGMQPLLLCRNHLDDFYKRLRKNNCIRFQYFSCGEYGHLYSRPHFHIILFTDDAITPEMVQDAWTVDGYKIGNVDFHDLRTNGTTDEKKGSKYSCRYVFKYVCKYLMKEQLPLDNLKTIEYIKTYFNSLQKVYKNADTLFPELVKNEDSKAIAENWEVFNKKYSPFVSCSRRPAIGLQYLSENVQRFAKGDFRLFGLSDKCTIFPRYFLRKTKEYACSLRALGKESLLPSSSARMSYIATLLREIYNSTHDFSNFECPSIYTWRQDKNKSSLIRIRYGEEAGIVPYSTLSFYDAYDKMMFAFNGSYYTIWQKNRSKGYLRVGEMDILDVINFISSEIAGYEYYFVNLLHDHQVHQDKLLNEYIDFNHDGDYKEFRKYVYKEYMRELEDIRVRQIKYNHTKITF